MFLRFILQVAALMTAVHWVVHGGARDALEYQVSEESSQEVNFLELQIQSDCSNWIKPGSW